MIIVVLENKLHIKHLLTFLRVLKCRTIKYFLILELQKIRFQKSAASITAVILVQWNKVSFSENLSIYAEYNFDNFHAENAKLTSIWKVLFFNSSSSWFMCAFMKKYSFNLFTFQIKTFCKYHIHSTRILFSK